MANSVTQEQVNAILSNSQIEVQTLFDKTTVVTAKLPNGFIIVESSSCVDPANYCETLGKDNCLKRIENKVWELEGYNLQSAVAELNGCSTNDLAEMGAEFGFEVALSILKEGRKVKRKHWGGYWFLNDGKSEVSHDVDGYARSFTINPTVFAVLKDGGGVAPATPYQEDLLANDWMVVS